MKKLWILFPALILAAGLVMMGCPEPDDGGGGGGNDKVITWTLSADGAGDEDNKGTETTTKITISFSANIASFGNNDIAVGGQATMNNREKGTGNDWIINVNTIGSGWASVTISKQGVEPGTKQVRVWKEGEEAVIGYTAVPDGEEDVTTSTKITFTFTDDVSITADDITITAGVGANGGDAVKDTLSGSDKTWILNILTEKQGTVTVKIDKEGIFAGNTTVTVFKKLEEGPPAIPEDGQTTSLKWHKLEVDTSDTDPDEQDTGKGVITGEDFDAIVAATAYQGTYLRIYLDLTEREQYPGGALGNIKNAQGVIDGGLNATFSPPAGEYGYVDITLKDLKKFYEVSDESIFVNIWNGAKIRAILLYEPIPAVPEEELPAGVYEFTLGNVDSIAGKGFFTSPDVAKLNESGPGSYLELYFEGNNSAAGYGIGNIMTTSWAGKIDLKVPAGGGESFVLKILVADIKYALGVLDYDLTTKHANGTITADVGLNIWGVYLSKLWLYYEVEDGEDPEPPEPPEPPAFPVVGNLGDYTIDNGDTQKGWASNGVDGAVGPEIAEFKAAKYIVLKITGLTNRSGLGGLQFEFQSDIDNWVWMDFVSISGDWTGFATDEDDITYLVIDMSSITDWTTATANSSLTKVKLLIGGVDAWTLLGAWLLEDDAVYTKPGTAVDLAAPQGGSSHGYLVKEADFDWELPEGEVEVEEPGEPGVLVEDKSLTPSLAVNETYGHQGLLESSDWGLPNGQKIIAGEKYKITFSVSSSVAVDKLQIFLVDNSEAGGWWNELSSRGEQASLAANTATTVDVTLTVTKSASSTAANANKLAFATEPLTASPDGPITLTITGFKVERLGD